MKALTRLLLRVNVSCRVGNIDIVTIYNSFLARGDFCRLLLNFANSLDPDQDQRNVGPDLDPNQFDTLTVFLKESFEKVNLEKKSADDNKKHGKYYPACKELT